MKTNDKTKQDKKQHNQPKQQQQQQQQQQEESKTTVSNVQTKQHQTTKAKIKQQTKALYSS